jgi:hypothetical protein
MFLQRRPAVSRLTEHESLSRMRDRGLRVADRRTYGKDSSLCSAITTNGGQAEMGVKIAGLINLLAGLIMVGLAVGVPVYQGSMNIGLSVGLGVGGLACLLLGVLFMKGGGKLLGNDPLLATGVPATAVIRAVRDTGITLQAGVYAILEFNLEVSSAMGSQYQVTCRSTVPRIALSMVGIGKQVAVRVDPADPNRIAIDWGTVPS